MMYHIPYITQAYIYGNLSAKGEQSKNNYWAYSI